MKRFFLYFLTFIPLYALAQGGQFTGSGYYRVQNTVTLRYMSIVDTKATINETNADLKAIYMRSDFEDSVAFNPATICYVTKRGDSQCNLTGQGLDLYKQVGRYLNIFVNFDDSYRLYGSVSGISKYLIDTKRDTSPYITEQGGTGNRDWWALPVDQSDTQYFGIKADVSRSDDYYCWSTMYAGFPFIPSSPDTKVYTVKKVDYNQGYAVISEIKGDVPAETPVLFRCYSEAAKDNKLELLDPSTEGSVGSNLLVGNYYCNDVTTNHRNVTAYDSKTMRMLGKTSDGKAAFVKSDITYLPANKCYLKVNSSAPDVLKIISEEEYTGISELSANAVKASKTIYDLHGRRVTSPSKGLYIVNGKKVVIR